MVFADGKFQPLIGRIPKLESQLDEIAENLTQGLQMLNIEYSTRAVGGAFDGEYLFHLNVPNYF